MKEDKLKKIIVENTKQLSNQKKKIESLEKSTKNKKTKLTEEYKLLKENVIKKSNDNTKIYKKQLKAQKEKIKKLNQEIKDLKNNRDININFNNILWERSCLGYNKGDYVFISYKAYNRDQTNDKRTATGFVHKETLYHINILVYDRVRNSAYKYSIKKDTIMGMKYYDDKNIKSKDYKSILELWGKD